MSSSPPFSGLRGPLIIDGVVASHRLSLLLALALAMFFIHKGVFTLMVTKKIDDETDDETDDYDAGTINPLAESVSFGT